MSDKASGTSDIYDLTPRAREVIEWRAKRRLELRNEYLREKHNPNLPHEGHLLDPAIQRQYSTNFAKEKLFRPTIKNFLWMMSLTVGLIGVTTWRVKVFRDEREHKFRTGQVSYRDREWKFV